MSGVTNNTLCFKCSARRISMATPGPNPSEQDAKVQDKHGEPQEPTDLLRSEGPLGILKCTTSKSTCSVSTLGQHRSQQDAKTRSQSIHPQGRQLLACWQHSSPGQRRIPHWEVNADEFADEFLICIRNFSVHSSRRHIRRGDHRPPSARKHVNTNNKWSHATNEDCSMTDSITSEPKPFTSLSRTSSWPRSAPTVHSRPC